MSTLFTKEEGLLFIEAEESALLGRIHYLEKIVEQLKIAHKNLVIRKADYIKDFEPKTTTSCPCSSGF